MSAPVAVVIPCYRQERFLARTVAALEAALAPAGAWRGVIVRAAPDAAPLPPLPARWQVLSPPVSRPLTPGAARMLGFGAAAAPWTLFVDADVEVTPEWARELLARIAVAPPAIGGFGGRLEEWFVSDDGVERMGSADMYRVGGAERVVDYLATLACYRRDTLIAAGGYDARLSSEEDFELGLRIRRAGATLVSLPALAARHWSAPRPSLGELARRWRTGLCSTSGARGSARWRAGRRCTSPRSRCGRRGWRRSPPRSPRAAACGSVPGRCCRWRCSR
jgi:glycosyl transferase family 2